MTAQGWRLFDPICGQGSDLLHPPNPAPGAEAPSCTDVRTTNLSLYRAATFLQHPSMRWGCSFVAQFKYMSKCRGSHSTKRRQSLQWAARRFDATTMVRKHGEPRAEPCEDHLTCVAVNFHCGSSRALEMWEHSGPGQTNE